MAEKCKKCGHDTVIISLESNDEFGVHFHRVCKKNPEHPTWCEELKVYL